jgi:hypothetical protein
MNQMSVMDPTGHTEVRWNPKDADEVAVARETFNAMRARGYSAFRVRDGDKGKRIDAFDAEAEKMILIPQLVGG